MRVLFWGTPEFATPSLRALLGEGFDVAAVVTRTDKPRGRSRSSSAASPVKEAALAEGLSVLQPESPKEPGFFETVAALEPDVSVVVAYGHILPRPLIELPTLGTINVHASLLPQLRGAAPIQAAIRLGVKETGISIMQMVPALDAGPVLLRIPTAVDDAETYGDLTLRLSELGALALIEALALLSIGGARAEPQDESRATYAPKIDRQATVIDWRSSATDVSRLIRAYDPEPGARTTFRGAHLKLFGAVTVRGTAQRPPGTIALDDGSVTVGCGSGAVTVAEVQPAGRKRMTAAEWLRGRGAKPGDVLGT